MKERTRFARGWMSFAILAVLACWFSAFPTFAVAQGSQGQNAVCTSTTGCSTTVGTSAFIDASMFATSPPPPLNFCTVLNYVLTHGFPANGAVIDARGLNSTITRMTCTASPWAGIISPPPPSTILLPAGTILIPTAWVLPSNTHVIGQGDNVGSGTTLRACNSQINSCSFGSSAMIQFGSAVCLPPSGSGSLCPAMAVENLVLDGQGQAINGIVNTYSAGNTYVDHVSLYQILGTGLLVSEPFSGPYSNINFDTGGSSGTSTTACVKITASASATLGFRGLRCVSETIDAPAAILLDASNTSIKDVTIVGFRDGILVGSNSTAQSDVLVNIAGDTTNPCYPVCPVPINAVHISAMNPVSDLVIMGLSNAGGAGTFTIADDATSTNLLATQDPFVGMYILGKQANNGHARFTTSPNVATWAAGTSKPTGTCSVGSIYSCTGDGPNGVSACNSNGVAKALWGCPTPGGTWTAIK